MLTQLRITNFAIINELEITFNNGLTVLTGETGAGKSIIADALDFLLGLRATNDLIKTASSKALVEGTFLITNKEDLKKLKQWMEKNGFDIYDDNIITLSRELTFQGSKARVNGSLANISHLSCLREFLLDIHQQSEHIELLEAEKQIKILDSSGNIDHAKLISDYKKNFEEYQIAKNNLKNYLENSENIEKKINLLEFELDEINTAKINNTNEDKELREKRNIILNKKELIENSNTIFEMLSGESRNGIIPDLIQLKKLLSKLGEFDGAFEEYVGKFDSMICELKELSNYSGNYSENFQLDKDELEATEERLDSLEKIKKKYKGTLEDIVSYYENIKGEFENLKGLNSSAGELEKIKSRKENEINDLSDKLTKSREKIAHDLVNNVNEELLTLGFKSSVFVIGFTPCDLTLDGKETVQFLFTSNPDEPPKPLLKVASGGELSRIMLAIKSVISAKSMKSVSMIFDEIDSGVSGEIASSVAKKLYRISRNQQTICITHQPIIAAMADQNLIVEKIISDGSTHVTIREASPGEKANILAGLLTPEKISKEGIETDAKQFAKSLLENARKIKEKEFSESLAKTQ